MAVNKTFCTSNGTFGYSGIPMTDINGDVYERVFYKYTNCPDTSIQHLFCPKRKLIGCFCLLKTSESYFTKFLCNAKEVQILAFARATAGLLAVILNIIVLSLYLRRKNIRHKVGNILLASQAVVDLFNSGIYAMLTASYYLIIRNVYPHLSNQEEKAVWVATLALYFFSIHSSMYTFTLISYERYLAVSEPFWHRQNVTRSWIMKRLLIVLVLTTIITPLSTYSGSTPFLPVLYPIIGITLLLMIIVSILFTLSYSKAHKFVTGKASYRAKTEESTEKSFISKKLLRLTLIFLTMYAVFLMALVSMVVFLVLWLVRGSRTGIPAMVHSVLLAVTSIINPVLTLSLRKDFKIIQFRCQDGTELRELKKTRKGRNIVHANKYVYY